MTRTTHRVLTAAIAWTLTWPYTPLAAQGDVQAPQTFRSASNGVFVDVSVRQGSRPLTGLKATDFALLDNGVPQQIAEVSYERLPIDVTVVLDISSSVNGTVLDRLRRAIDQLRTRLGTADRLKLMTFNTRVRRLVDFSDRDAETSAVFGGLTGSGGTALFDALAVAMTSATTPERRQLIVMFSDGQDTSSISHSGVILDLVQRSPTTITFVRSSGPAAVVSIGSQSNLRADGVGMTVLPIGPLSLDQAWRVHTQVARESGGTVITSPAGDDLRATFTRVLDEFRSSYVLRYTAVGAGGSGFHTLSVSLKRSGTFDIRARRGYFAD